jgi:hypothetical protein
VVEADLESKREHRNVMNRAVDLGNPVACGQVDLEGTRSRDRRVIA